MAIYGLFKKNPDIFDSFFLFSYMFLGLSPNWSPVPLFVTCIHPSNSVSSLEKPSQIPLLASKGILHAPLGQHLAQFSFAWDVCVGLGFY